MATPNFAYGKYGKVFDYLDKQPSGISEYDSQNLNQMQDWQVPQELAGNLSLDYTPGFETEGGPVAGNWRYNTHNLPATRFGNDLSTIALIRNEDDYNKLRDKNLAYYDPNYGFITHHNNYNDDKWSDYIPTAIMAAASAGFGSLVGPGLAAAYGSVPAQAGQMAFNLGKGYAMGSNNESTTPTIKAQGLEQSMMPDLSQIYAKRPAQARSVAEEVYGPGADMGITSNGPGNELNSGGPIMDNQLNYPGGSNTFDESAGNFDWGSLANGATQLGNWFTNGGLTSPMGYLAGIGMATKQWDDADKWTDQSEQWAQQADPFGQYRPGYGEQLQRLNENPSEYLKTLPGYQAALEASSTAGIQRLTRGQQGMSNTINDITAAAGDVANKTYASEATRLAGLAGANIDPAVAARLRQAGLEGSINSQNAALGSLMAPFGSQMQQNASGGGGAGTGSNWDSIVRAITGGSGRGAAGVISGLGAANLGRIIEGGGDAARQVINSLLNQGIRNIQLPDGTNIDVVGAARVGGDNGAPYPIRTDDGFGNEPGDWGPPEPGFGDVPPDFDTGFDNLGDFDWLTFEDSIPWDDLGSFFDP